jgi:hypothetical protein
MLLRSMSILAAAAAIALILPPGRAAADPLLDTDTATNESTDRGPDTVFLLSDSLWSEMVPLTPSTTPEWPLNSSETGGSDDDDDFLTPILMSLGDNGFPLRRYQAQAILSAAPEPSLTFLLTCGLVAIALATRSKR